MAGLQRALGEIRDGSQLWSLGDGICSANFTDGRCNSDSISTTSTQAWPFICHVWFLLSVVWSSRGSALRRKKKVRETRLSEQVKPVPQLRGAGNQTVNRRIKNDDNYQTAHAAQIILGCCRRIGRYPESQSLRVAVRGGDCQDAAWRSQIGGWSGANGQAGERINFLRITLDFIFFLA